ncbi:hypothetical protein [Achromobacter sp. RTa]|nr:hypothetical protein [Achromobacter sp. RTa]
MTEFHHKESPQGEARFLPPGARPGGENEQYSTVSKITEKPA